MTVLRVAYMYW